LIKQTFSALLSVIILHKIITSLTSVSQNGPLPKADPKPVSPDPLPPNNPPKRVSPIVPTKRAISMDF
jgi:hypothetical protein